MFLLWPISLAEKKNARQSRKQARKKRKTLSIEDKCSVVKKIAQQRRKKTPRQSSNVHMKGALGNRKYLYTPIVLILNLNAHCQAIVSNNLIYRGYKDGYHSN